MVLVSLTTLAWGGGARVIISNDKVHNSTVCEGDMTE